jgi:single-strand DNA-binding protein
MNVITLTGNAVQDPSLKFSSNGVGIATGSIAVRRDFKNKQTGEYETDFINWKALGGLSEVLANHIKKGDKFGISGRLQVNQYEKDGEKKYFTEVIVNNFDFPTKSNQTNQSSNTGNSKPSGDPFANDGQPIDISDEDLPF